MPKSIVILALLLPLTACATSSGDYPSLAIRDAERVTGTLQPAEPVAPDPLPATTLASVEDLFMQATQAHEAFLGKLGRVQNTVLAARGSGPGSDGWGAASVAIAEVETDRSKAMIALADLDRLHVDAMNAGTAVEEIAAAQDRVGQMVDEETAKIGELMRALGG